MKKVITAFVASSVISLSGCASFAKHEVANVEKLPDVSQYQNKPSVYIDFRVLRGDPGTAGAPEVSMARDQLKPQVEKLLADSQLFSRFSFDESTKSSSDYTLKLYVYNHGSVGLAAVSGFLCGFTFGVIPAAATDNYTLMADSTKLSDSNSSHYQNKDAITTWMGIWFIPAMSNSPAKAATATITNQVKEALKHLVEDGTLKYSLMIDTHGAFANI